MKEQFELKYGLFLTLHPIDDLPIMLILHNNRSVIRKTLGVLGKSLIEEPFRTA
jgi:hypothetical protein